MPGWQVGPSKFDAVYAPARIVPSGAAGESPPFADLQATARFVNPASDLITVNRRIPTDFEIGGRNLPGVLAGGTYSEAITMRFFILFFIASAILPILFLSCTPEKIRTEEVKINSRDGGITGYIAFDSTVKGKRPGIVVIPEYWGQKDYARERARRLAELGYTALVLDIFDDGDQSQGTEAAAAYASGVLSSVERTRLRFLAGEDLLKRHATVDPLRIGAIGYCFGGNVVITMARLGADLKTGVVFHGNLKSLQKSKRGDVKGSLLVFNAAGDTFVPREDVAALTREMTDSHTNMVIVEFKGPHAFTNKGSDKHAKDHNIVTGYDKEADEQSWKDMGQYLSRRL